MVSHAAPFLSIKNNSMKSSSTARELIIKSLKEKAVMKLEIYKQSKELFKLFKENLQEINVDLAGQVNTGETKLGFNYAEKSDHEASISFAGDTLIFHLHSNVFNFDKSHFMYNSPYIKQDEDRAYCSEGKRQLGYLYNDFSTSIMNKETSMSVIESAVLYAIDFDLLTPNYEQVKQVSIGEIYYHSEMLQQKTGKRMGFLFQADNLD
jgi:hypothetical protein